MRIGNWPLLLLTLEHVIKHPDEYNQEFWVQNTPQPGTCGTTRGIGGWIAHFAGYTEDPSDRPWLVREPGYGQHLLIEFAAVDALDIDPDWESDFADDVFGTDRTFQEILGTVADYADADGVTPTPLIVAEMFARGVIPERTWS